VHEIGAYNKDNWVASWNALAVVVSWLHLHALHMTAALPVYSLHAQLQPCKRPADSAFLLAFNLGYSAVHLCCTFVLSDP
jgi:hypothetical protein